MALLLELARLCGLLALLLCFAALAIPRAQPFAHATQSAAIGLAALCQAWLQSDAWLVGVALIVATQAWAIWRSRTEPPSRAGFPIATLCAALLLVVLAIASAPADGMGVPLAIVLLGLLGAATAPGPYGLLATLNGTMLAMTILPGLPLRLAMVLALAALGAVVGRDGAPLRWQRP